MPNDPSTFDSDTIEAEPFSLFPNEDESVLFPSAEAPAQPVNPPLSLFPDDNETLRRAATDKAPADKAARIYKMQLRTGLPIPVLERNLEEVERSAAQADFDPEKFRRENPKLAKWMTDNPNFGTLASGDTKTLSAMETFWLSSEAVFAGTHQGLQEQRMMMLNWKKVINRITPQEEEERLGIKAELERLAPMYAEGVPGFVKDTFDVISMQVPPLIQSAKKGVTGLALGAVAGGTLGYIGGPGAPVTVPAGALVGGITGAKVYSTAAYFEQLYQMDVGEVYSDLEDAKDVYGKPIDPQVARFAALVAGVPNSFLETLSLQQAIKIIPGAQKIWGKVGASQMKRLLLRPTFLAAMKEAAGYALGSAATEGATESIQKVVNIIAREMATGDVGEGVTPQDYEAILAEGFHAGRGTLGSSILFFLPRTFEIHADIARAQRNETFMRELGAAVKESKMQQTSPEAMSSFVTELKKDSAVQNVFIPVDKWDAQFQENAAEAAKEVFGSTKQYLEAKALGGDLVIPIETYTEKVAGTNFHEALIQDIRLGPADLTPREAIDAARLEPEFIKQAEQDVLADAEKQIPVLRVMDDIRQKLVDSGMNFVEAEENATLAAAREEMRAQRLGQDAWELYSQNPLQQIETPVTADESRAFGLENLAEQPIPYQRKLPLPEGRLNLPPATAQEITAVNETVSAMSASEKETGVIGATVNIERGNLAHQEGVAVSAYPQRGMVVEGAPTKAQITTFTEMNRDIFARDKDASLGVWVDRETNKGYLDIVTVLPRDNAIRLGERLGELAVWDLGAMEEIRLPATEEGKIQQAELFPSWKPDTLIVPESVYAMRGVTNDAMEAFIVGKNFKRANTEVRATSDTVDFLLYGKTIASWDRNSTILQLSDNGVQSNTTKERLNGILEAIGDPRRIVQRQGQWYIGDEVWRGRFITNVNLPGMQPFKPRAPRPDTIATKVPFANMPLDTQPAQLTLPGISPELRQVKIDTSGGRVEFTLGVTSVTGEESVAPFYGVAGFRQPVAGFQIEAGRKFRPKILDLTFNLPYSERRGDAVRQLVSTAIDYAHANDLNGISVPLKFARANAGAFMYEQNLRSMADLSPGTNPRVYFVDQYKAPPGQVAFTATVNTPGVPEMLTHTEEFFRQNIDKFMLPEKGEKLYRRFNAPVTTLTGEEVRHLMSAMETAENMNVPRFLIDRIKGIAKAGFDSPENQAQVDVIGDNLSISDWGMRQLYEGSKNNGRFMLALIHEFGHLATIIGSDSYLFESPQFAVPHEIDFSLRYVFAPKLRFENGSYQLLNAQSFGPVMREVTELVLQNMEEVSDGLHQGAKFRKGGSPIAQLLLYPMGDSLFGEPIEYKRVQAETFAQIWALYFVNPEALQQELPVSYNLMHELAGYASQSNSFDQWLPKLRAGLMVNEAAKTLRKEVVTKTIAPYQGMFFHSAMTPPGVVANEQVIYQAVNAPQHFMQTNMNMLLKTADVSTFLRESSRAWLDELRVDAQQPGAPAQLVSDWNAIKVWIGATNAAIPEEAYGKFASSVEGFMVEGKTPPLMGDTFGRFKDWAAQIYKSARMRDMEITPEITGVMDSLLAADEAVKALREYHNYDTPLLDRSMMTEEEYKQYAALNEEAKRQAEDSLRVKVMRQLRRENIQTWREERQTLTNQLSKEISERPIYRALYWLQNGVLPDGTKLEGVEAARLDKAALQGMGVDLTKLPPRTYQNNGIHPDVVAELYGFESGKELMNMLTDLPTLKQAIDTEVTAEMNTEHGDLLTGNALPEQAAMEIQNTRQLDVLGFELRVLKRLGAVRRLARPAILKDLARQIVGRKPVGELDPRVFESAAIKAGEAAEDAMLGKEFRAGTGRNLDAAFDAKQRQLLDTLLYKEALAQRSAIDKSIKTWNKFLFRRDDRLAKTRNMDMINAARAIAAARGIGRSGDTAATYMNTLREYDPLTYQDMHNIVEQATSDNRKWEGLTVDEFGLMSNAIEGLLTLSRRTKQIEIDGKKMLRGVAVDELNSRIAELSTGEKRAGYDRAMTKWEKTKMGLIGVRAALRRTEAWVDAMDNGDPAGAFRKYIYTPISEAGDRYRDERMKVMTRFMELTKPLADTIKPGVIPAPEIGYEFYGKAELLGALLHTGNDSNLQKLLRGRNWGEFNAEGELDTSRWDSFIQRMQKEGVLTKTDYDFVQGVWDILEELKPATQAAHKEIYGYYFNEITAHPFTTLFGEYHGGYFPANVDPFLVEDAAIRSEKAALEERPSSFMFPTTGRGPTFSRIESYARPLSLDLGLAPQHIQWALRFTYLEPHIRDVGRLMIDRNFRAELAGLDTEIASSMLMPWLQRAARQTVETPSTTRSGRYVDSFFRTIRQRTGANILFANAAQTLQQFTGLSISATKVNPRYLAGALWRYIRAPREYAAQINDASMFMRSRITTSIMEVQQAIDNILLNPTKYEQARAFAEQHAYFGMAGTQNIVDLVTWGGAYEQAIENGSDQTEAVRIANSTVRETQGTFTPEDISRMEAGPAYMRVFTMFYTYFNMEANLLGTEFVKAKRKGGFAGGGRALYVYMMGFMLPAVLSEALVRAVSGELFDDKDDDGYLDNLLSTFFNGQVRTAAAMLPVIGPTAMVGVNMFNDKWYDDRISTSPAVSALEASARVPYDLYKVTMTDEEVRLKRPIQDTLTMLGLVTGFPVAPLSRPLGYITDVEQGYVQPEGDIDYVRGLISGRAP